MSSIQEDYLLLVKDTKTFLENVGEVFIFGNSSFANVLPKKKIVEKPPEPPVKPAASPTKASFFSPMEKPDMVDDSMNDIQKAFTEFAPEITISKEIPGDKEAKWIAEKWKLQNIEIAILTDENPLYKTKTSLFLENLTKALSTKKNTKLFFATELEKKGEWNSFLALPWKKILIEKKALSQLPQLLTHFKHFPSNQTSFLENVSLFVLEDLSLYLKNPTKKRKLWLNLSQQIMSDG
jgi:hypothetical protein